MQKRVNQWKYEFSCKKCAMLTEIHEGGRNGVYCLPMIQGKRTIHADDDYRLRCDCYVSVDEGGKKPL